MKNVDVIILSNASNEHLEKITRKSLALLAKSETEINLIPLVIEQNPAVSYPGIRTIYKTEKFNYNKFMNYGIEATDSEWIAMCNNDILYRQHWASELIKIMEEQNIYSSSPIDPLHQYGDAIMAKGFEKGYTVNRQINGFCIMINRKLLNIIGKLDEENPFWGADVNYSKQLIKHNIEHILVSSSRIIHLNHSTLSTLPKEEQTKLKTFI